MHLLIILFVDTVPGTTTLISCINIHFLVHVLIPHLDVDMKLDYNHSTPNLLSRSRKCSFHLIGNHLLKLLCLSDESSQPFSKFIGTATIHIQQISKFHFI